MEGMVTNFFRGKSVLITGDTGFKGAWLAFWLSELGSEVTGLALPPRGEGDLYHVLGLDKSIRHIDGDIRNQQLVQKVFEDARPQVIFHLAAQSLVRYSYDEPKYTFDTNVGGSVNVLEAARKSARLESLVYVTSDKCYKNLGGSHAFVEDDPLGGSDPYSASKAAAEIVFSAYCTSFLNENFGAASVRAGNVIGGGDWAQDRIVPDCIRSLRAGKPIVLRNPQAIRPWQHVLEPLWGYISLAERLCKEPGRYTGAWNFGPADADARTVREVAAAAIDAWGGGTVVEQPDATAPHEASFLRLDSGKAARELGWRARWNFERAVSETVRWYKNASGPDEARQLARQQIRAYTESIR